MRLAKTLLAVAVAAAGLASAEPEQPPRVIAVTGGTIIPVAKPPIENGTLLVRDGIIEAVGAASSVSVPADATRIDATGRFVFPGIIDTHSHLGVYSWPGVFANSDGNEATDPVTAQVRAEDSINVQDPGFDRARAGGVTAALILPGSANIIGGEGVVVKLRPGVLAQDMKMAEAPRQIKMAMGENPKRVYGGQGELPSTRMGIVAKLREAFTTAQEHRDALARHAEEKRRHEAKLAKWKEDIAAGGKRAEDAGDEPTPPTPPDRDPLSETLVDIMEGRVRVNVHCYRKDDIESIIRVSDEFGFKIAALHHVLEGYKVAPELARRGIAASTWADWWGFKMEALDATPWNMAIMQDEGVLVAMQSDSADLVQRLYMEAAKLVQYGMTEDEAMATITLSAAKLIGVDRWTGSLEPGKQADFAIYSAHPLDPYTRVEKTFIDGFEVYDRATQPVPEAGSTDRRRQMLFPAENLKRMQQQP